MSCFLLIPNSGFRIGRANDRCDDFSHNAAQGAGAHGTCNILTRLVFSREEGKGGNIWYGEFSVFYDNQTIVLKPRERAGNDIAYRADARRDLLIRLRKRNDDSLIGLLSVASCF